MRHLLAWLFLSLAALLSLLSPALAQNFAQPKVVPTGNWPTAVYSGDFDGDGHQDLLYLQFVPGTPAGQNDTLVKIVYGDGAGNFSAPVLQGSLNSAASLAINVGDVNADGITDLVFIEGPVAPVRQLSIGAWFGTRQRTLDTSSAPASHWLPFGAAAPRYTQLVTIKLAGQNILSLVALDAANAQLVVFAQNGFGGFQPTYGAPLPDGAGPAVVADINHDGIQDLVVLGLTTHTIDVFLGTTNNPVFQAPIRFAAPSAIHSFLIQDVTYDAIPDLIAEGPNGHIDVFPGNGDGTFQTSSAGGTGPLDGTMGNGGHLIAIADLNHDGQVDALTSTPIGVSTLLGQGTQYFGLKGIYNAGPGNSAYAAADFNGDGNLDLAVDSPEGIAILFGNPDGSFQSSLAYAAGQPALSGAVGVFTSSGNTDAVVSTTATQAQILRGQGDGTFAYLGSPGAPVTTTSQTGSAGLWSMLKTGDLDGDGKLDLVLTADGSNANLPGSGTGLVVQLGNGDGTFGPTIAPYVAPHFTFPDSSSCSPPFSHYPGLLFGTSVVADFNGDGLLDIANRGDDAYRILRGNNGSYSSSYTTTPTLFNAFVDGTGMLVDCDAHAHDLVITGDLDNDGRSDLIYQGSHASSGSLLVYLTDSTGTPILAGDLAIDGSLTSSGQLAAPALNPAFNGAAVPTSSGGLGFPAFIGSGVVADLDGDGNNDLIVAYANLSANLRAPTTAAPNYIYIWYGSGGGKFLTSAKRPVNPVRLAPSRNFYQVAVGDLNGDGIPDLILSDGYIVSVQLGVGDGAFGAETHYLAGQGLNTISVADLNHDGRLDLVLANGGAVLSNPVANLDVLASNPDVNTGGVTVLLNGASAASLQTVTGSLTASPEPSYYSNPFSISATLTAPSSTIAPTGTISFAVDGTAVGSASLSGLTATLAVPSSMYATLAVGSHTLTGSYSGDSNYSPNNALTGAHNVVLIPHHA